MECLRYSVMLIIVAALAGGIWTRYFYTPSVQPASSVELNPTLVNSGLQVTGTFDEPVGGLTGFEVSFPNCPRPLAILPVTASFTAIIPTEYRYRRGDYDISYVYKENVYPEAWISYKLSLLRTFYQLQSLLGLMEARQFAYYLKIWTPSGCHGISNSEASALERDLAE
jgi:hypothetical protein